MTKEQLLPLAKTYFDSSPDLKEIFGTGDKQFFYKEFDAKKYCARNDKQYYKFVSSDLEEKEVKLTPKQALQAEAKKLGVEFTSKTSVADLETMIEIKKEEG